MSLGRVVDTESWLDPRRIGWNLLLSWGSDSESELFTTALAGGCLLVEDTVGSGFDGRTCLAPGGAHLALWDLGLTRFKGCLSTCSTELLSADAMLRLLESANLEDEDLVD